MKILSLNPDGLQGFEYSKEYKFALEPYILSCKLFMDYFQVGCDLNPDENEEQLKNIFSLLGFSPLIVPKNWVDEANNSSASRVSFHYVERTYSCAPAAIGLVKLKCSADQYKRRFGSDNRFYPIAFCATALILKTVFDAFAKILYGYCENTAKAIFSVNLEKIFEEFKDEGDVLAWLEVFLPENIESLINDCFACLSSDNDMAVYIFASHDSTVDAQKIEDISEGEIEKSQKNLQDFVLHDLGFSTLAKSLYEFLYTLNRKNLEKKSNEINENEVEILKKRERDVEQSVLIFKNALSALDKSNFDYFVKDSLCNIFACSTSVAEAESLVDQISKRIESHGVVMPVDVSPSVVVMEAKYFIFSTAAYFISRFNEISSTTYKYSDRLQVLLRSKVKRNKWGDVELDSLDDELDEFLLAKLDIKGLSSIIHSYELSESAFVGLIISKLGYSDYFRSVLLGIIGFSRKPDFGSVEVETSKEKGVNFELEIASILTTEFPDFSISTTKGSGDFGADIVVEADVVKIVIQAKYYSSNVGNSAVQEVFAARAFYDADYAVVVTNSDFTNAARVAAAKTGVFLTYDHDIAATIRLLVSRSG